MDDKDKIQELSYRLDQIIRQQKLFQHEMERIRGELELLRVKQLAESPEVRQKVDTVVPSITISKPPAVKKTRQQTPWEEFIGTNLLNKAGIAVLVLGIGIGAKYSIDHDLISPFMRIVLGYLAGLGLLAIAYVLRKNHAAFSAVLLSGGMAVMYFVTFVAWSAYELIPQLPAFALMVIFTAFTVFAALRYNMEVIGIVGLTGAYAVPLLLSDGSGGVVILFSYIAIINGGILLLAFRKYWKRLYYTSFILTWLTFMLWFSFSFYDEKPVFISLLFSTLYLLTFYAIFLAYKLIRREALGRGDLVCMLANSFFYFGFGYLAVSELHNGEQYLGAFAFITAVIHFAAVPIAYAGRERSGDLLYFTAGMVLVFLTIAVPVQLDGNWVTIIWAIEAALLFWIGRARSFPSYEKLSYPLMVLSFISLTHDWSREYSSISNYATQHVGGYPLFFNVQFLTSMFVGAAFVSILFFDSKFSLPKTSTSGRPVNALFNIAIPILTVVVMYTGFFKEIEAYWNQEYAASHVVVTRPEGNVYDQYDESMQRFKTAWLIMFSAIFGYLLYAAHRRLRNNVSLLISLAYIVIVLFALITTGLFDLSALRSAYLRQELASYYPRGLSHIFIRYAVFLVVLPLLWCHWKLVNDFVDRHIRKTGGLYLHLVVLVILSSELVHWLELARVENSFKLSLSILWGAYALIMIIFGLSRDVGYVRIGGMILFGVTLLKLFVYDMLDMSTILKTVVMIILGALLLVASFIYNRHKRLAEKEAQER